MPGHPVCLIEVAQTAKQEFSLCSHPSVAEMPGHPPGYVLSEWALVVTASRKPQSLATSSTAFLQLRSFPEAAPGENWGR